MACNIEPAYVHVWYVDFPSMRRARGCNETQYYSVGDNYVFWTVCSRVLGIHNSNEYMRKPPMSN